MAARPLPLWLAHAGRVLRRCARHAPARATRPEADSPPPATVAPRRHAGRARPACPVMRTVCASGLRPPPHTAAAAQAARARPAWRRGTPGLHARAEPLGGAETAPPVVSAAVERGGNAARRASRGAPGRPPLPPQRRAHGAGRPVRSHARHGQPPAPLRPWRKRARGAAQTAGLSAHGGGAEEGACPPAGAGLRSPATAGLESAPGGAGPALPARAHPPREAGCARRRPAGADRTKHAGGTPPVSPPRRRSRDRHARGTQGAALDPPGAPPLDPRRGARKNARLGQVRLAAQAGGGPEKRKITPDPANSAAGRRQR